MDIMLLLKVKKIIKVQWLQIRVEWFNNLYIVLKLTRIEWISKKINFL